MERPVPTIASVLKNTNFRLLWIGQGTSLLGDQFFLIALPWLVLKLTNDPLALGTVLALTGIPRALFMLIGGAITDRYSPRAIMLASDALRLLLTILLTVMILTGWLHMWMLYLLALSFGVISGFFNPASGAMIPTLVKPEELQAGNSLYQGTVQLSLFLGPVLAGGLIAQFAHVKTTAGTAEMTGIAAAVAIDSLTFLVSIVTLLGIKLNLRPKTQTMSASNILASIGEGVRFVWQEPVLRLIFMVIVAANFLFLGPLMVGIPVLANSRLLEGAAAYGIIMGGLGGGNLVGILLASRAVRLFNHRMGNFMIGVVVSFGVGLILLGLVKTTWVAFLILFLVGVGNGVLNITGITFLQRQTPKEMLGRMMSLILMANVGLLPISQALSGALIKLSLPGMFALAGAAMLLVALWMAFQPATPALSRAFNPET